MADIYNGNIYIVQHGGGYGQPDVVLPFDSLAKAEERLIQHVLEGMLKQSNNIYTSHQAYERFDRRYVTNMQLNTCAINKIVFLVTTRAEQSAKEMTVEVRRGWNYELLVDRSKGWESEYRVFCTYPEDAGYSKSYTLPILSGR